MKESTFDQQRLAGFHVTTDAVEAAFVPATGWGAFVPWYDPLVALFTREAVFKRHMLDRARVGHGLRVLDVGCGTGTLALAIAATAEEPCVLGVDADARMLAQARRKARCRGKMQVQWLLGRSTRLPIEDRSIDLVTCSLVLHHLTHAEKRATLRELRRVVPPGGRLLLVDYGRPTNFLARLQFLAVRIIDGWKRTRCNVTGRLPELIRDAGWRDVRETLCISTLLGTLRGYEASAAEDDPTHRPFAD